MSAEEVIFVMLPAEWCVERNNQYEKVQKKIDTSVSLLHLLQTQQTQNYP